MSDMTASGRESLRVGASAFRAAVLALRNDRPGAEESVRRIAGGLEKLAISYRAAEVADRARILLDAPSGSLGEPISELLAALERLDFSSPEPLPARLGPRSLV